LLLGFLFERLADDILAQVLPQPFECIQGHCRVPFVAAAAYLSRVACSIRGPPGLRCQATTRFRISSRMPNNSMISAS
jgi:hypothetical protein